MPTRPTEPALRSGGCGAAPAAPPPPAAATTHGYTSASKRRKSADVVYPMANRCGGLVGSFSRVLYAS